MRRADRIAGAAGLVGSVAFSAGALNYYAYWGPNGPGPAFLPLWLGLVMAVLSTTLLVGALRSSNPGERWLPSGEGLSRLLLVVVATALFVALLPVLGMALGTVAFVIVLMRRLGRHPWPLCVAVAAGTAAFNFVVFTYWLKVPFPVGLMGF